MIGRLGWIAVLVAVLGVPANGPAQTAAQTLERADASARAGRWLEAERLYRGVLEAPDPDSQGRRPYCLRQLLDVYTRLNQHDRVIQVARRRAEFAGLTGAPVTRGRVEFLLGRSYLALRHYPTAAQHLDQALTAPDDLAAADRIGALLLRAEIDRTRGDGGAAAARVRQAAALLDGQQPPLPWPDRVALGRQVARAELAGGLTDQAFARLQALLGRPEMRDDAAARRDALADLAAVLRGRGRDTDLVAAATALEEALRCQETVARSGLPPEEDGRWRGDLWTALGLVRRDQRRGEEARQAWGTAATQYQLLIDATAGVGYDAAAALDAYGRLAQLYRSTDQLGPALQLAAHQEPYWAGNPPWAFALKHDRAALQALAGAPAQARPLLAEVVNFYRRQEPADLARLPRALNDLALTEYLIGDLPGAQVRCRAVFELYRRHGLPDDLNLAEASNLLGAIATARGEFAAAVPHFRRAADLCRQAGPEAEGLRCNVLLNLAAAHRSQGEFAEARALGYQALQVYAGWRGGDPEGLAAAALNAALAGLDTRTGQYTAAQGNAEAALALCRRHEAERGPVGAAARHALAVAELALGQRAAAEARWQELLAEQLAARQPLAAARTLNYLGAAAEVRGRDAEAEAFYRRALDQHAQAPGAALPVSRFLTHWRLAQIAERRGDRAALRDHLVRAIDLADQARVGTFGAEHGRAQFFAQFAPAFDALVDAALREGDLATAFAYGERGRSRTLLDQLRLAGLDPRAGLRGTAQEGLLDQEAALCDRLAAVRARATATAEPAALDALARELADAQKAYAGVWQEIVSASPAYRRLLGRETPALTLAELRGRLLGPDQVLLRYYLTGQQGHLLVVGRAADQARVVPLAVPAALLAQARQALGPAAPAEPLPAAGVVPLTRDRARLLVTAFLARMADPDRPGGVRGLELAARPVAPPAAVGALLGDVLLPPTVWEFLTKARPQSLVVIPDGALHQLPFEALVLSPGPPPRYVLDELPPISYAPSAGVLAALHDRPAVDRTRPPAVLTVGDPAYPERAAALVPPSERLPAGLAYRYPRLPGTAAECRHLAALLRPAEVTALQGPQATEAAVKAALAGKRLVHLAAHAVVDDRYGNLFGAVILTPPAQVGGADDGFLTLQEIPAQPLQDCEAVILSACSTFVGPERPMEAGVTLAGGFLAAGARHVVASHWSVADDATAALMQAFFTDVVGTMHRGAPVDYAAALQRARQRVRQDARWADPYYWAPFVVLGPPTE